MKKSTGLALIAVLFAIGVTATPAPKNMKPLKRSAKVYKGPEGEKVTLVYLEPSETGDVLIKFEDVDGEWNGKVLMHKRNIMSNWGPPQEDFATIVDDGSWVSMYVRGTRTDSNGDKYPNTEVTAKGGHAEFRVRYSESESKATDAEAVIRQFRRDSGIYDKDGELKKKDAEKAQNANAKAIQLYTAGKKEEAIIAWQKLLEVDPLNDHAGENIRTALAELAARQ